ncbi:MAG TPA: substrate-binding domain-containing protein [Caldimonas sp.]|jgi:molybdate transport system substrate-binding protein|nr:substrate-binding domain-containing protein [Caldimonas sp.]
MANDLNLLCAGAVKGLVLATQGAFERDAGVRLNAGFGAVGAIRDLLRAGTPCDVFIATDAMVESLAASGALQAGSRRTIGRVQTAIAVKATAPSRPRIDDAASLRSTLLDAAAIYFPDATLSTAGKHVASIIDRLGLQAALASRLRMFANGATAMRELAADADEGAIGCTQATEIRYTPGLALVGALPPPYALATVYSAGVAAGARDVDAAHRLIELLAGAASADRRAAGGFDADA